MGRVKRDDFNTLVGDKLGVVIHRAAHAIFLYSNERVKSAGVTIQQAIALLFIHHNPGCNQKALEVQMRIRGASVTVLLNTVIEKGLIEKRRNPRDARNFCLVLTDKGKKTVGKCRSRFKEVEDAMIMGIDPDNIDNLKETLRKITANCSEPPSE